ncbi:MAG: UxaA family hydrolase [Thermodesulfobacteriota bacterium]
MTSGTARAIRINARDNCAVLLTDVKKGDPVEVRSDEGTSLLSARQAIASGHKIALAALAADQPIIKYGEEIGRAQSAIEAGDWIHLHNVYCLRGHETP